MESLFSMLFSIDLEIPRNEIHDRVLNRISKYYLLKGYKVVREYPIQYSDSLKRGYIDMFVWKPGLSIGIEYDNGIKIKNKSIKKLASLSPCVSIFIVNIGHIFKNIERFEEIRKLCNSEKKYFLSLKYKIIKEL